MCGKKEITKVDLHVHTYYSVSHPDLRVGPLDYIIKANKCGIKVVAFADHNSVGAWQDKRVMKIAKRLGIIVVPAIEVTPLSWGGGPFHIVIYGLTDDVSPKEVPVAPDVEEIREFIKYCKSICDCVVILAHPYFLYCLSYVPSGKIILKLVDKMKIKNLIDGIEVCNYTHPRELNEFALKFKNKYHFKSCSVGTDAHNIRDFGTKYGYVEKEILTLDDAIDAIKNGLVQPKFEFCCRLDDIINKSANKVFKTIKDSITDLTFKGKELKKKNKKEIKVKI